MSQTTSQLIETLNLEKHPEGGHYREVYRAAHEIEANGHKRAVSTSIYYLLQQQEFSAFHKIDADELWHLYAGGELIIHMLSPQGNYSSVILSSNGNFQCVVPAGVWFAAELVADSQYALCGCTVSPGFVFEQFALAERERLQALAPQQEALIQRLCIK